MFRVLRVLFLLAALMGAGWLFYINSEPMKIYYSEEGHYEYPAFVFYTVFIMLGIVVGYIISLKNVFAYRSEISKLVKKNKEISEELDSLRNVAVGEEFTTSFTEKE
tara:strand:- start:645 stop:965 length:321 start_codon:yes stop_codon:yes gene_type:complete